MKYDPKKYVSRISRNSNSTCTIWWRVFLLKRPNMTAKLFPYNFASSIQKRFDQTTQRKSFGLSFFLIFNLFHWHFLISPIFFHSFRFMQFPKNFQRKNIKAEEVRKVYWIQGQRKKNYSIFLQLQLVLCWLLLSRISIKNKVNEKGKILYNIVFEKRMNDGGNLRVRIATKNSSVIWMKLTRYTIEVENA